MLTFTRSLETRSEARKAPALRGQAVAAFPSNTRCPREAVSAAGGTFLPDTVRSFVLVNAVDVSQWFYVGTN